MNFDFIKMVFDSRIQILKVSGPELKPATENDRVGLDKPELG